MAIRAANKLKRDEEFAKLMNEFSTANERKIPLIKVSNDGLIVASAGIKKMKSNVNSVLI